MKLLQKFTPRSQNVEGIQCRCSPAVFHIEHEPHRSDRLRRSLSQYAGVHGRPVNTCRYFERYQPFYQLYSKAFAEGKVGGHVAQVAVSQNSIAGECSGRLENHKSMWKAHLCITM